MEPLSLLARILVAAVKVNDSSEVARKEQGVQQSFLISNIMIFPSPFSGWEFDP